MVAPTTGATDRTDAVAGVPTLTGATDITGAVAGVQITGPVIEEIAVVTAR